MESLENHLLISEFHLTIILELRRKFITKRFEFFKKLYDKGDFIEEITEQLYDTKANQFLADRSRYLSKNVVTKPTRRSMRKMWFTLNATDLINPKSTITWVTPVLKSTKHWFCP